MIKQIIVKEISEHLNGFKFKIVLISCLVLLGFNHLVMYQNYQAKIADSNLKFPEGDPIAKNADPLSVYITGTSELLERIFQYNKSLGNLIEMHMLNTDVFRQYFPLIDFNFLVRVILSFLAMVIGFDAFCGEKQQGTLKLMLSNSVSRGTLLWGKFIGNLFTLIIPLIVTVLLYYLILSTRPDIHFTASDNIRLLLILIVSIIYLSIFLAASMAISASSTSVTTSIIKSFIAWVIVIFILQNPAALFTSSKNALPDGRKIEDLYLINLIENSKTMPDSLARNKAFFDYTSEVLDYRSRLKRQIKAISLTSLIIPPDAFNLTVTTLGKCGLEDEDHYRATLLMHHKEIHAGKKDSIFKYHELGLKMALESTLKYFVSLSLFLLGMLILAKKKFNNYDIR